MSDGGRNDDAGGDDDDGFVIIDDSDVEEADGNAVAPHELESDAEYESAEEARSDDSGGDESEVADPMEAAIKYTSPLLDSPPVLGCQHYSRGCSLVASCCEDKPNCVFSCRFCHDAAIETHKLDRKSVAEVVCNSCQLRQTAVDAIACFGCGVSFGVYCCTVCHLYDDKPHGQFHCDGCGICRIGGAENFKHCDVCGYCLAASAYDHHKCFANAMNRECVICMQDMNDSRVPSSLLPCGHLLHQPCFNMMLKHAFGIPTCPTCKKTAYKIDWVKMDEYVAQHPMPAEIPPRNMDILCNDCLTKANVVFNLYGVKCPSCGSYNTA